MGMAYKTREGPTGALNIWTVLATQGSNASPGPIQVPLGKTKIKQLFVSIGASVPTAAEGGTCYYVRLSGATGIEQVIAVGSRSDFFGTEGTVGGSNAWRYDVDIPVTPGAALTIESCPCSGVVAETTGEVAVTVGFV